MFDFGSGIRNEGDLRGVNTKGLVTFDRQTRKDPFYFYKANWSAEPVTHIVGRPLHRPRVRDDGREGLQQRRLGAARRQRRPVRHPQPAAQCPLRTCVFERVVLQQGKNVDRRPRDTGGAQSADEVVWTLANATDVNIAAGQLATGLRRRTARGTGPTTSSPAGVGRKVIRARVGPAGGHDADQGVAAPADAELYSTYRAGRFRYDVPLANGTYQVALGFVEPSKTTAVGERVFDVEVNGTKAISGLDVLREAGAYRTVVQKTVPVTVSNGRLELVFTPTLGEAVVSTVSITKR